MEIAIAIIVIAVALIFDFTNGFHDAANAIASAVSTKAIKPKVALLLSACMNVVGALLGTGVADTIAKSIVDVADIRPADQLTIVLGGLLGAISWNLITWFFGLPSSSSHALIGGLAGAGLGGSIVWPNGGITVFWGHIYQKVVIPMVCSPAVGFLLAFIVMMILLRIFKNFNYSKTNKIFNKLQILSSATMSLGHGLQDAQKTMGIIFLCAVSVGWCAPGEKIPLWITLCSAGAISLGTYSGGFRIMKTVGSKIIDMDPIRGFVSNSVASLVLWSAAMFKLPLSTTHTVTLSIVGAGATKNKNSVKWVAAGNIVAAWVLTLPAAGIVGGLCFFIVSSILRLFGFYN